MRSLTRLVFVGTLLLMLVPCRGALNPKEFRIGYQKAANTLVLLKAHGTLEQRLRPLGIEVKWLEFTAGPQLLEGLNVGSIDFGYVGEIPPIFALAAGANLVYTAYELPTPQAEGITNRCQYFLSARQYAEAKPEVLAIAMEELGHHRKMGSAGLQESSC